MVCEVQNGIGFLNRPPWMLEDQALNLSMRQMADRFVDGAALDQGAVSRV
ncbi:hypothetical protein [uncultured Paludibaculum sp.]|nr:hypothetical protein [uncultured Paludibaculum sp.]